MYWGDVKQKLDGTRIYVISSLLSGACINYVHKHWL